MSNSVRRYPYTAYVGCSNAQWKRDVRRELRRVNKQLIKTGKELVLLREQSNIWSSPMDGAVHHVEGVKYIKCKRMKRKTLIIVQTPQYYEKAFRK